VLQLHACPLASFTQVEGSKLAQKFVPRPLIELKYDIEHGCLYLVDHLQHLWRFEVFCLLNHFFYPTCELGEVCGETLVNLRLGKL
jgi:hypothetical protein